MSADSLAAEAEQRLAAFLAKYEPGIQAQARAVRAKLQELLPGAVEMVYDNYNALVIGYGATDRPSEAVISMALMPRWVTLCFIWGVHLPDPQGLLKGSGNQVRNIRLEAPADLEKEPIRRLIAEAASRSATPFDASAPRQLIIKSVSAKQRPRRPKA